MKKRSWSQHDKTEVAQRHLTAYDPDSTWHKAE